MKDLFTKEKMRRFLLYMLYMFLTLALQNMILPFVRPLDVSPMVLPAAVVAVGMFEGATKGALFGLAMGIFADLSYIESVTTFTLLLPIIGFAMGFMSQFFINKRFFAYMIASLAAFLVTGLVQLIKVLVLDGWAFSMLTVLVIQALWSLPFAVLVYFPPAKWIER